MIKKLMLTVALAGLSLASYGQGTVIFRTDASGSPTPWGPRAFQADGTTPAFGSFYYAQLYAADGINQPEGSLTARGITPVNFKGSSSTALTAGYVQTSGSALGANGSVGVNQNVIASSSPLAASGSVTLQIRAWVSTFATYEAAPAASRGQSITFNWTPSYPSATPGAADTLNQGAATSVPSFVIGVPEPSTIALGIMGLGALMIRRRK